MPRVQKIASIQLTKKEFKR